MLVFTTTSPDFAIDGYAVNACGYLVKPFTYEQFEQTMNRLYPTLEKDYRFIEVKEKRCLVKVLLNSPNTAVPR